MDQAEAIKIVTAYKALLTKHFTDCKVYLYGSYSKGTAHKDSDIDVAVVVPQLHSDWWSTSTSLWSLTRQVNTLIEPVLIEESHPSPLYEDILRTGVRV